jgi:hypothetical protein
MSQVFDLCECSNDSVKNGGVYPNTASVPSSPLLSRKRPSYKQGVSNYAHPRNENGPGNKRTATRTGSGSAGFVFDLELAAEVDVLPNRKKRRGVVEERQPSGKKNAMGNCAKIRKGVHVTKKDVGSEDAQVTHHRESQEGIAAVAAASHPMNLDSQQTSRDKRYAKKRYQKASRSKSPSNALGQRETSMSSEEAHPIGRESRTGIDDSDYSSEEELPYQAGNCAKKFKEDRLSELADYRKIHGHCNVQRNNSERDAKLAIWVINQRTNYRLRLEGKKSSMTLSDVKDLENLGFEWKVGVATWQCRLSELTDYRKIHGNCNVPRKYSENLKLGYWVENQRSQYRSHLNGNKSSMTLSRIQELESLGFEWDSNGAAWEERLGELADYRKIHGNCNVPRKYSENLKLACWVETQKKQYNLYVNGNKSHMTDLRILSLESLGFEWKVGVTAWEDRLSELTDYREIHGHCNVPGGKNSENMQLGKWVAKQRNQYRLHVEGKKSQMTLSRIQGLESLAGFEWKPSISRGKEN